MIKKIDKIDMCSEILNVYASDWACYMETDDSGEERSIELVLVARIIDMYEATGEEEHKNAPWSLEIDILPRNCHRSISVDMGCDEDSVGEFSHLADVYSYCGGVPVIHKLLETDSINNKIMGELKAKDAVIKTIKPEFGTVAAQKGRNFAFSYPQFTNVDAAEKFAEKLIKEYGPTIMSLVGFTLDAPINMAGDSGWSTIETCVKGVE